MKYKLSKKNGSQPEVEALNTFYYCGLKLVTVREDGKGWMVIEASTGCSLAPIESYMTQAQTEAEAKKAILDWCKLCGALDARDLLKNAKVINPQA